MTVEKTMTKNKHINIIIVKTIILLF